MKTRGWLQLFSNYKKGVFLSEVNSRNADEKSSDFRFLKGNADNAKLFNAESKFSSTSLQARMKTRVLKPQRAQRSRRGKKVFLFLSFLCKASLYLFVF